VRTGRVSRFSGLPAPLSVVLTLLNGHRSRLNGEEAAGVVGRAVCLHHYLSLPVVLILKKKENS
jgi:hypothetical protein